MEPSGTIDQVARTDIAYIRRHWTILAATAWQGYIIHGRGSLLIDMSRVGTPYISYCIHPSPRSAEGIDWMPPATVAQLRQYDPHREMVCIILHDNATLSTYRLGATTLPPPDAYAHLAMMPQPIMT